jgi:hypothetical protein
VHKPLNLTNKINSVSCNASKPTNENNGCCLKLFRNKYVQLWVNDFYLNEDFYAIENTGGPLRSKAIDELSRTERLYNMVRLNKTVK